MSDFINIMWLFETTFFQVGDIVRISETAFGDSEDTADVLARGQLAEIIDIEDDGISEDWVNEALYYCLVQGTNDLFVVPVDSELKLVARVES